MASFKHVSACFFLLFSATNAASMMAPPPPPTNPGISFNFTMGSYMVLQQSPAISCVYGMLGAGGTNATIKVSDARRSASESVYEVQASTTMDGNGWKACLKPHAMGGDVTITATCMGCTNSTPAVAVHVTFGDVWYCSGQSNMALSLQHAFSRNISRDAILSGKYANIRIQGMKGNMNADQPWATLKQALNSTPDASSSSVAGAPCDPVADPDCSALMRFPAACYYFGESLTDMLGKDAPPIGLVNTAWGGSAIEQWLKNDTILECKFSKTSKSSQEYHDTRVLPYADMTVKGFVWYQGENDMFTVKGNSGGENGGAGYSCLMKKLVEEWRSIWSATPGTTSPDAPFGIVSLASSGGEGANGLAMGAMRQAQTAGYGYLPHADFPNTFLAHAYDLDDEWASFSGGGPCMSYGYNASDPHHNCCGAEANATICTKDWASKCANMCKANEDTHQYMGGLHPRSKKPVGLRLATAALNTVYGGSKPYAGPTLSGCSMTDTKLTINFNKTMLRGENVLVRKYASPNFTPYFHGRANPGFHSGSQLWVQTVATSFCIEYLSVNQSNSTSDVYCPEWAGGVGPKSTRPHPNGRFPTFGGSGATPTSDPNQFNMGWINLPIAEGPTPDSISVDLSPLQGKKPTAVRYAWGIVDCCDLSDPTIYSEHGCIANCPVVGANSLLPANPFMAKIENNKCKCVAPQVCDE